MKFPRGISSRVVFMLLGGIMLTHMAVVLIYTEIDERVRYEQALEIMIQRVLDTIYLVQITPEASHKKAVFALSEPSFLVTMSSTPRFDLQFESGDYWELNHELYDLQNGFRVSLQTGKDRWLNFEVTIEVDVPWLQFVMIILELFIAFVVMVWGWSISRFTRPLQDLKRAAERLGVDIDPTPTRIEYGPLIVRETAEAMNKMQERIHDLIQDRTHLLAAISHDLRTPITRIKLRAQCFEGSAEYEKIIKDLDEMEAMIVQVLDFIREETSPEKVTSLDLTSMLSSLCVDMAEMGLDVTYTGIHERIVIQGKALALKRAFTNLIHNAVNYGIRACVNLKQEGEQLIVMVDDEGPGIADEHIHRVFEPFYRIDPSRSRKTGGVGLGLAITRGIIQSHYGKIRLYNRREGGLRVMVTLSR